MKPPMNADEWRCQSAELEITRIGVYPFLSAFIGVPLSSS
jgi:hypothetical protein